MLPFLSKVTVTPRRPRAVVQGSAAQPKRWRAGRTFLLPPPSLLSPLCSFFSLRHRHNAFHVTQHCTLRVASSSSSKRDEENTMRRMGAPLP